MKSDENVNFYKEKKVRTVKMKVNIKVFFLPLITLKDIRLPKPKIVIMYCGIFCICGSKIHDDSNIKDKIEEWNKLFLKVNYDKLRCKWQTLPRLNTLKKEEEKVVLISQ